MNHETLSAQGKVDVTVMRKCASCGKEKPIEDMKICMDSRPMHRYVCDAKCMKDFYK